MIRALSTLFLLLTLVSSSSLAKDPPAQVLTWPPQGVPLVRFTLGKFVEVAAYNGQKNYRSDVLAENLWSKPIHLAAFHVYFYDKDKVRNGEGYLSVSDLAVNGRAKFEFDVTTTGRPDGLELVPANVPDAFAQFMPKKEIPITVNSVPQGAVLKVDGQDAGTTPKIVKFSPGKHLITFALEGYGLGKYPFEVKPDDAPGGSITLELGSAMHDTVELRDGSVLTGDVESLSATDLEIRIGGNIQKLNRNSVKRILLIERVPAAEAQ